MIHFTPAQKLIHTIDDSINNINKLNNIDEKTKTYLAKYLVVIISGIFEESIKIILLNWVQTNSSKELYPYIEIKIRKNFRNPKMENIKKLLKDFNVDWFLPIGKLEANKTDALDSIVNQKNALAHGVDTSITLNEIIDYYTRAKEVIKEIDKLFISLPPPSPTP
jgi:hypothetical protein